MSSAGEVTDEGLFTKEDRSLGSMVKDGMFHAVARWLEQQGTPDVRKERFKMWQRIDQALPPGRLKDWHGRAQWFADLDAQVAGWSGKGKNFLWKVTRRVIAGEFPPVLLLPDTTPSILDAWSARIGGAVGEAVIKGGISTRQRIDQIMASMSLGAMKPLTQGGVA